MKIPILPIVIWHGGDEVAAIFLNYNTHLRLCNICNVFLKSISISRCKSFLLFYNKNLFFFLFYTINLQKHPHQIISNTPSFIKIILSHIFPPLPIHSPTTLPHTTLPHTTFPNIVSLSFSLYSFYFLLSSSTFFILQYLLSFASLSFFFFFISNKKKKILSFSPFLSLSNRCSLQIWKISLNQASTAQYTHTLSHTLSHGSNKPGFWVYLYFAKWVYVMFYFELILL